MMSGEISGIQTGTDNSFGGQSTEQYGGYSLEDYMNMGPEEQLQAQSQMFKQYGSQQLGLQNQLFGAQAGMIDQRQQEAQSALDTQKAELEGQDQEDLSQFKEDQQAQIAQATGQIEKSGAARQEQADLSMAFQGFGRSTKAAEIRDNIRQDTQAQIADIARQSNYAVNEYQASLLDKTNERVEKLQARVDKYGDAKDQLSLDQIKSQGDLMMDLWKQDPMSPQNMVATADKLTQVRLQQQKMDMDERKAIQDSAQKNFEFMITNFGSDYLKNLDTESLINLSSNIGISPQALMSVGPTIKEADKAWEQYKYTNDVALDQAWKQYQVENDGTNRMFQAAMSDQNYLRDLEKMGIKQGYDKDNLYLGLQIKDEESKRKLAALGFGTYAAQATDFTGGATPVTSTQYTSNSNSLAFPQPIQHPTAKANDVVAMNPALVNAYPAGYKKAPGKSGLGGQCAFEARMIANIEPLGNSPASKLAKLKQYASQGKGFLKGKGTPQPGDVLVSNASKQYGHAAIVNAVCANGDIILSEFNYAKPLTFSNNRRISATSGEVVGFIRNGLKPQYQVKPDDIKKAVGQAAGGALAQNPILNVLGKLAGNNSTLGAIGGALAGAGANAMNGAQTRSDLGQVGGVTADMFNSPQQLASFVQQNGVSDLQNQDFWKNSPFKQQAWNLLQSGQQPQQTQQSSGEFRLPFQDMFGGLAKGVFGSGQQSQQFNQQSDQQFNQQTSQQFQQPQQGGMPLSPIRQQLQSGTMSDFQLNDIYKTISETGDPTAMAQFAEDYQIGQKLKKGNDFNQQLELTKQKAQIENQYKPITDAQSAAATYATRMQQAEDIFDQTAPYIGGLSPQDLAYQRNIPAWGGKDDRMKAQEQAELNFITAVLRRESGAAIGKDEYDREAVKYFPQPGDSAAGLAQKKQNRALARQGMLFSSGPQGQQYYNTMYPQQTGGYSLPEMSGASSSYGGNSGGYSINDL